MHKLCDNLNITNNLNPRSDPATLAFQIQVQL